MNDEGYFMSPSDKHAGKWAIILTEDGVDSVVADDLSESEAEHELCRNITSGQ